MSFLMRTGILHPRPFRWQAARVRALLERRGRTESRGPLTPGPSPARGEGGKASGGGRRAPRKSSPLSPRGRGAGGEGAREAHPEVMPRRACTLLVMLVLAGCAPSAESANPWAEYRPARESIDNSAAGAAPDFGENIRAESVFDRHQGRPVAAPRRVPSGVGEYPPPAPPAEDSSADLKYPLADKPPAPPDLAAGADMNPDFPAHWTGAVIYCQPGCVPCAMLIRDLRKAGWKCGVGAGSHFKIVELLTLADFEKRGVPSTPQTVYFIDGVEQPPRITGYGGSTAQLAAIANRHAKARRSSHIGTAQQSSACNCLTNGLCTCDGDCQCAPFVSTSVSEMTFAASPLWYEAAPDCGAAPMSVAVGLTCAAPAYPSRLVYAPPAWAIGPAIPARRDSAQLSLFGFPLIGASAGTTMNW
jgi:hypothetical protein